MWSDPLAGLVTGVDAESSPPLTVPVGKPVMPDIDEVRRAVDAALREEEQAKSNLPQPRSAAREATTTPAPGIMSNPRPGWPRPPSVRQLRVRLRSVASSRPAKFRRNQRSTGQPHNAVGIGVVIALLMLAIVLAALISYSLIDSVSNVLR